MLMWLDGAPEFQVKSAEVTGFVDNIITFQKPTDNPELLSLVNRQVHRHSHSRCKNTKAEDRFNYLRPPMRQTKILYPLDTEMPESKVKIHSDTWKSIKKHLVI